MSKVKSLAKDTVIYGLSSIIGRFLNWCLVPLYTGLFATEEYGIVTYVYSIVAIVIIVLTYGMETGFFRFANHKRWKDPKEVYSTALISLAISSTVFFVGVLLFLKPITHLVKCDGHPSYVWMTALFLAVDAFTALPFCYLRYLKRPIRFATIKCINIGLNIGLNLFFLLLCPWLVKVAPSLMGWYRPDYGIGYIFLSNLLASLALLPLLSPWLHGFKWTFNSTLWREIIVYSFPMLLLGIAGIMNQTLDKILLPDLWKGDDAMDLLGIYGANYKIAIVMVMFIQAFRFAYEPFIFAQNKEDDGSTSKKSYSDAMKFFCIMSLFIFIGVMYYLDIIRYIISPKYFSGLAVVPIVMLAEFFFGIHFNLSVWYKLSDRTQWGTFLSFFGLAITVGLNYLLIPHFGYMGCAWAAFGCYFSMMVANYFIGQHYYPIDYPVRRIFIYVAIVAVLYVLGLWVLVTPFAILNYAIRAVLLGIYILLVLRIEKISLVSLCAPILSKARR